MLSRRTGIKAAIALPFANLLPHADAQADDAMSFEERASTLFEGTTYYELMSIAYLGIDIMAVRIKMDVPKEWTTRQALVSGRVDITDLETWASHVIHRDIVAPSGSTFPNSAPAHNGPGRLPGAVVVILSPL